MQASRSARARTLIHACRCAVSVTPPKNLDSVCYWINIWRKLTVHQCHVKHYSTCNVFNRQLNMNQNYSSAPLDDPADEDASRASGANRGGDSGAERGAEREERDPFLTAMGDRVRLLRARRGMTRKTLATETGLSERHLAKLESGVGNASV